MTNIKTKLVRRYEGLVEYFESHIGGIEIIGNQKSGYFIHPKGKLFADQTLSTIPAYDIEGLALFLQGVAQSERVKRRFEDESIASRNI